MYKCSMSCNYTVYLQWSCQCVLYLYCGCSVSLYTSFPVASSAVSRDSFSYFLPFDPTNPFKIVDVLFSKITLEERIRINPSLNLFMFTAGWCQHTLSILTAPNQHYLILLNVPKCLPHPVHMSLLNYCHLLSLAPQTKLIIFVREKSEIKL